MSGVVVGAPINSFSAACAVIVLEEHEGRWGRLDGITESGDMIIADIEGVQVELPGSLAATLEPLLGQRVVVGCFDGNYRAGRCSA